MKNHNLGCPLCNSAVIVWFKNADATKHPFYHQDLETPVLKWMRCDDCGHVFTATYWTDEGWKLIFAKSHSNQVFNQQDAEIHRYVSGRILDKVITYCSWPYTPLRPGGWLDIGCGNGSLLFTAAEFGFEAYGIDLREEPVKAIRELGYRAEVAAIEDYIDTEFDIISMADVLEHTPFPKDALGAAKSILKPGGVLYISCPNSDTAIWKMLGDDNPYWCEIEHFHNFSRARLTSLLEECGFEVLRFGVAERYLSGMELICRVKAA